MSTVVSSGPALGLEFYETPETHTQWLFNEIDICGTVLDPCAGNSAVRRGAGSMFVPWSARPGERTWIENDLDPYWGHVSKADASSPLFWSSIRQRVDWVVTNPAFSIAMDVLAGAIQAARFGVALYLRASIHEPLETGIRRTFFAHHPPTGILWLPRFGYQRSPKFGSWATDSVTSCWCIWQARAHTQFIRYAPDALLRASKVERTFYRARMDALMGFSGTEQERRAQARVRATSPRPPTIHGDITR